MARQSSIITVRGKIGNVVGMKNGFGTPTGPFIREYISEIKNPQSDFQMDQRAKMLPAVLFRRQLESVISRAWEGKKYGGPSIREFMKYALKEPWEYIPQLPKGSTLPIPGNYLVSRGSLPPLALIANQDGNNLVIDTGISFGSQGAGTIGDISRDFIASGNFKSGDQITIIIATTNVDISWVAYNSWSFFLDESVDITPDEAGMPEIIRILQQNGSWVVTGIDTRITIGGCVVQSREGNNSHLRGTQRFITNYDFLQEYFANSLKASIVDSYRISNGRSSLDWPYQEEDTPTPTDEDAFYTLSGLTGDRASLNGSKVRIRRNIESQQPTQVYVTSVKAEQSFGGNPPFVVNSNNSALTYRDSGNESYYLQLSQVTALANLSTISVD